MGKKCEIFHTGISFPEAEEETVSAVRRNFGLSITQPDILTHVFFAKLTIQILIPLQKLPVARISIHSTL